MIVRPAVREDDSKAAFYETWVPHQAHEPSARDAATVSTMAQGGWSG